MSRQCLRESSVFLCEVRANIVVWCYVCVDRQLDSCLVIMELGGACWDQEYLFCYSRRREAGVWQEGQGRHRWEPASGRASCSPGDFQDWNLSFFYFLFLFLFQ